MDPRIAWFAPEHLGPELWTRLSGCLWERLRSANQLASNMNRLNLQNNNSHNQDFIPLELDNHRIEKGSPQKLTALGSLNQSRGLRHDHHGGHAPWRVAGKTYLPSVIG